MNARSTLLRRSLDDSSIGEGGPSIGGAIDLMPCVLVVEDDADVRDMLRTILETEGYETVVATNGAEALEAMQERKPCVVLLDLMMPVMDGWTFRERQLEIPHFADVPVICLTAVYDPEAASQALRAPCLHKPVEMDALLDRVEQVCWRNQGGR